MSDIIDDNLEISNCKGWETHHLARILYDSFQDKFPIIFKGFSEEKAISTLSVLFGSMIRTMKYSGLIIAKINNEIVGAVQVIYKNMDDFSNDLALDILKNELGFWKGWRAAILLGFLETKPYKNSLVIDGIAVDENYRSKGIGKELLNYSLKIARNQGLKRVLLKVILKNERVKLLYEKFGFETIKKKSPFLIKRFTSIKGYYLMKYDL